jgi:hypothetical protein
MKRLLWRCDDCRTSFNEVPIAPMLEDAVWLQLAGKEEMICGPCMFKRADRNKVHLTLASLRPCAWNIGAKAPEYTQSWFDVFSPGTPKNESLQWLMQAKGSQQYELPFGEDDQLELFA